MAHGARRGARRQVGRRHPRAQKPGEGPKLTRGDLLSILRGAFPKGSLSAKKLPGRGDIWDVGIDGVTLHLVKGTKLNIDARLTALAARAEVKFEYEGVSFKAALTPGSWKVSLTFPGLAQ